MCQYDLTDPALTISVSLVCAPSDSRFIGSALDAAKHNGLLYLTSTGVCVCVRMHLFTLS